MSKTFRFFGCYLLSVVSVLGVVGNAFGQGQEKDAKQEIVKHERVLPSVKLGKSGVDHNSGQVKNSSN